MSRKRTPKRTNLFTPYNANPDLGLLDELGLLQDGAIVDDFPEWTWHPAQPVRNEWEDWTQADRVVDDNLAQHLSEGERGMILVDDVVIPDKMEESNSLPNSPSLLATEAALGWPPLPPLGTSSAPLSDREGLASERMRQHPLTSPFSLDAPLGAEGGGAKGAHRIGYSRPIPKETATSSSGPSPRLFNNPAQNVLSSGSGPPQSHTGQKNMSPSSSPSSNDIAALSSPNSTDAGREKETNGSSASPPPPVNPQQLQQQWQQMQHQWQQLTMQQMQMQMQMQAMGMMPFPGFMPMASPFPLPSASPTNSDTPVSSSPPTNSDGNVSTGGTVVTKTENSGTAPAPSAQPIAFFSPPVVPPGNPGSTPITSNPAPAPMMMYPPFMMPPVGMGVPLPMGQPPIVPFAVPLQPATKGLQPAPTFVNIARKAEPEEPSEALKMLLAEEEQKRNKRLERNRDSARQSRRRKQNYVQNLEMEIKHLHLDKTALIEHRWGQTDVKAAEDVILDTMKADDHNDASLFAAASNMRRRILLEPRLRAQDISYQFHKITDTVQECRSSVLQAAGLVQAARSSTGSAVAVEISNVLRLSNTQRRRLEELSPRVMQEMKKLAILSKVYSVVRTQALEASGVSEELHRHMARVLPGPELDKTILWSEKR